MASAYKSYQEVKKVQEFLNNELAKGTITGEPLEVDGKWGPLTTEAFVAWVATQPSGTDVSSLVNLGVLTPEEVSVIGKAWSEHEQIMSAKGEGGALEERPPMVPPPVEKKGWSTMTWVLIGAAVAGAGLLGWWWMKSRRQERAMATAGLSDLGDLGDLGNLGDMGDLGEPGDLGEGTMVSLGAKKRGKRGKKSLGCGCGG